MQRSIDEQIEAAIEALRRARAEADGLIDRAVEGLEKAGGEPSATKEGVWLKAVDRALSSAQQWGAAAERMVQRLQSLQAQKDDAYGPQVRQLVDAAWSKLGIDKLRAIGTPEPDIERQLLVEVANGIKGGSTFEMMDVRRRADLEVRRQLNSPGNS